MSSFIVKLPMGHLLVEEKGDVKDYPGVYISYVPEDGGMQQIVSCVECLTDFEQFPENEDNLDIRTEVYAADRDDPVAVFDFTDSDFSYCNIQIMK